MIVWATNKDGYRYLIEMDVGNDNLTGEDYEEGYIGYINSYASRFVGNAERDCGFEPADGGMYLYKAEDLRVSESEAVNMDPEEIVLTLLEDVIKDDIGEFKDYRILEGNECIRDSEGCIIVPTTRGFTRVWKFVPLAIHRLGEDKIRAQYKENISVWYGTYTTYQDMAHLDALRKAIRTDYPDLPDTDMCIREINNTWGIDTIGATMLVISIPVGDYLAMRKRGHINTL
jgi:hypothetical protein